MQTRVEAIERVVVSHWHSDHTGGLLSFLKLRGERTAGAGSVVVDVHPNRPIARGIAPPPTYDKVLGRLPDDPSFEDIRAAGAVIEAHSTGHAVAGDTVYVSGEIPRITPFEGGILGGIRWTEDTQTPRWVKEEVVSLRCSAIYVS